MSAPVQRLAAGVTASAASTSSDLGLDAEMSRQESLIVTVYAVMAAIVVTFLATTLRSGCWEFDAAEIAEPERDSAARTRQGGGSTSWVRLSPQTGPRGAPTGR